MFLKGISFHLKAFLGLLRERPSIAFMVSPSKIVKESVQRRAIEALLRKAFTRTTISIGMIVGLGLKLPLLGATADVVNFRGGFFVLDILTTRSCFLTRQLPERAGIKYSIDFESQKD